MKVTLALVALVVGAHVAAAQGISYAPTVGAATPTSFTVAVRAPDALSVAVRYKPDTDADYGPAVVTIPSAARDWIAQLNVSGLKPATVYDYTVTVGGTTYGPYQTRTFPAADDYAEVNLALMADHDSLTAIKNPGKPLTAYATVLGLRPDALLQVGDFPHFNPALYPVKPANLGNWRLMHRTVMAEAFPVGLSPWTPPFEQDPDDHDAAKQDASLAGKAAWRAMLLQAHDESFPSRPRTSPTKGLWESYRMGRHVEVVKLDVRSQKQPKQAIEKPGHTMLGATQKAWFKATLLASTATWKVVITPLAWQASIAKLDGWFGYALERNELEAFFLANDIRNVIFVSGDNHCGFLDDGTHGIYPEVNLPGTNTVGGCSSGYAGNGSHGVISKPGLLPAGAFGWLTVDATGLLTARLIRADGLTLHTMALVPR